MKLTIRKASEEEFLDVYDFVRRCEILEDYTEHFYKIMLRYFGDTCFIAMADGKIAGFVFGFISQSDGKTYFLWQIGVDPSMRRSGTASALLEAVEGKVKDLGCERIELTVSPDNRPSRGLFEGAGYKNVSRGEGETIEVNGSVAVKDYYRPGGHFILYEKVL